jgi:hypothetical protein
MVVTTQLLPLQAICLQTLPLWARGTLLLAAALGMP